MFTQVASLLKGRVVLYKQAGHINKASKQDTYTGSQARWERSKLFSSGVACFSGSASLLDSNISVGVLLNCWSTFLRAQSLDFRPEGRHHCHQSCLGLEKGREGGPTKAFWKIILLKILDYYPITHYCSLLFVDSKLGAFPRFP